MTPVDGLLRGVWREPRAPGAPPVGRRDLLLLLAVPLAAAEVVLRGATRPHVLDAVVLAVTAPLLLWRRSHPLLALVLALVPGAVLTAVRGHDAALVSAVVMILLPYALARWGSGREIAVGGGFLVVHQGVAALTVPAEDAAGGLAVLALTVAVGLLVRARARARERSSDRARLRERERLARDLHDTVAHHVSAIAVRAQVGQALAAATPSAATDELARIEEEARQALAAMRGIVGVLRSADPADTVTPGVADLHRLTQPDASGVRVDVRTDPLDAVDDVVLTAVVRIAQESVTNARRHARRASRVAVHVRVEPGGAVHLTVHDDGAPVGGPASTGYGLTGMAERAALLGGTCEAGPDPAGGWTVRAVLPRRWSR